MRTRWPAEWERHEATWLSWPHSNCLSWADEGIHRIRPTMLALAEALAPSEYVHVNVTDDAERTWIDDNLNPALREQVRIFDIPTNDPWCRDHGPTFVIRADGSRAGICWGFNGWGEKYEPWTEDALASNRMVEAIGMPAIASDLVLEPGGIEGNGAGLALISERSVVDERRNPGRSRDEIEAVLKNILSLEQVLWVDLEIEGDDTDGHVDNFARFVSEKTLAVTPEGLEANPQLKESEFEILRLPSPEDPVIVDGLVCPASYANFYVANQTIIVPQFGDPHDSLAMGLLTSAFPSRRCVPLDGRELIAGQGGFHCITQQVPSAAS